MKTKKIKIVKKLDWPSKRLKQDVFQTIGFEFEAKRVYEIHKSQLFSYEKMLILNKKSDWNEKINSFLKLKKILESEAKITNKNEFKYVFLINNISLYCNKKDVYIIKYDYFDFYVEILEKNDCKNCCKIKLLFIEGDISGWNSLK